ncbi:MAG: hypothetical protein WBW16_01805 [Bacteroidota bacterium]
MNQLSFVDGKIIIRLAVLAFRTHLQTIEMALEILKEKTRVIEETN